MSVMENLLADVNRLTQTAAEPQLSFYACQTCGDCYRSERMLETCPGCKTNARQWPGSTADEARGRAKRAAGVVPTTTTTNPPEVSNANTQPVTPIQSPTATGVGTTAESASTPTVPRANAEASTGEGTKVQPERSGTVTGHPTGQTTGGEKPKSRRAVKTKAEAVPVVETPAPGTAQIDAETDYRAAREARVAAFIEKRALNEFQPVPVGQCVVQKVGYTLWVGGKPVFRFKESFETGREFAADYNAARAEQPSTGIDVAACIKVTDPELEACLFKGDLIVSLNSGHGTEQVKVGDVIKIGAYRTRENRLRFAII